jgi:phosphotransferase system enzyme I (PtsI)
MEMPDDLPYIHKANADGVGLFRTEFLYLNHAELPDEDVQFVAYRKVARRMKGQEVILRTIDLGADKIKDKVLSLMRVTQNPALGLRGIRLCFAEQQLFVTQLRAMLRASIFGKLKIMIPMLASADEIHQVLGIIETVKASLRSEGIAFDEDVEIGAMIEVPSAAIVLEPFLKHFSFISVGTNDLIQYVLAVDRDNDSVAHLFNSSHPAILKLLADIFKKADRAGVQVSLCGEMAGNPEMTRLLLGLGLRRFSMPVSALLTVKERILHTDITEQKKMVQKIMRADDPIKVRALVEKLNAMSPPTKPSR